MFPFNVKFMKGNCKILTHNRIVVKECLKYGYDVHLVEFPNRAFNYDGLIRSLILYIRILNILFKLRHKIERVIFYSDVSNEHFSLRYIFCDYFL